MKEFERELVEYLLWGFKLLVGEGEDLLGRLALAPAAFGCTSSSFLGAGAGGCIHPFDDVVVVVVKLEEGCILRGM